MEKYNKLKRRISKQKFFNRRIEILLYHLDLDRKEKISLKKSIIEGRSHLKLRTQGRCCNCNICSPSKIHDKYKRLQKQYRF